MPTISQLIRKPRTAQKSRNKVPALEACPQKRGVCLQVKTMTPKKPNSALRFRVGTRSASGRWKAPAKARSGLTFADSAARTRELSGWP